jgi:hypothetical protein
MCNGRQYHIGSPNVLKTNQYYEKICFLFRQRHVTFCRKVGKGGFGIEDEG